MLGLASAQSRRHPGPARGRRGARVPRARAGWTRPGRVRVECADGDDRGARRRRRPGGHGRHAADHGLGARPDGERILTWKQLYDLQELPERLIVVGSGVTGAELAQRLPRPRRRGRPGLLPRPGAARRGRRRGDACIENVFRRRGMEVLNRSRAASVERVGDGVVVQLEDGRDGRAARTVLLAVGSVPQTARHRPGGGRRRRWPRRAHRGRPGLPDVRPAASTRPGDCTGVLPLASVAAMQGRIAMWHALGDAVAPLDLRGGRRQHLHRPRDRHGRRHPARGRRRPATEARARHAAAGHQPPGQDAEHPDGFVKLFARNGSGIVIGGVVVAPRASELIFPIALAVAAPADRRPGGQHVHGLPVDVRLDRRGGPAAALAWTDRARLAWRSAGTRPRSRATSPWVGVEDVGRQSCATGADSHVAAVRSRRPACGAAWTSAGSRDPDTRCPSRRRPRPPGRRRRSRSRRRDRPSRSRRRRPRTSRCPVPSPRRRPEPGLAPGS